MPIPQQSQFRPHIPARLQQFRTAPLLEISALPKQTNKRISLVLWLLLLISPVFWPNVVAAPWLTDFATLGIALLLSATLFYFSQVSTCKDYRAWLFLACLLLPALFVLLSHEARNPWMVWRMAFTWSLCWLVYMLVRNSNFRFTLNHPWIIAIILGAANLSVLIDIMQMMDLFHSTQKWLFPLFTFQSHPFIGFMHQTNQQALLLAFGAFVGLTMYTHNKSCYWLVASILPMIMVIASGSRSGFILLIFTWALTWRFSQLTKQKEKVLLATVMTSVLLIGTLLPDYYIVDATNNITHQNNLIQRVVAADYATRPLLWMMSFELGWAHPLTGIGYGNMPAHSMDAMIHANEACPFLNAPPITQTSLYAHNLWLQAWMEGGVILFGAMLGLSLVIIRRFITVLHKPKKFPASQKIAIGFLMLWMISGTVSVASMQIYFIVLLAIFFAVSKQNEKYLPACNKKPIIFIPCAVVALFWMQALVDQSKLEKSFHLSIQSPQYFNTFITLLNNPWQHASALGVHFYKMNHDGIPESIWAKHRELALMHWQVSQNIYTLQDRIHAAHAAGDILEETRLSAYYEQAFAPTKKSVD